MTESRLENRACIPQEQQQLHANRCSDNTGAMASNSSSMKATTSTSSKLNPAAKSFVFNTAAPAWTPPTYTSFTPSVPAPTPSYVPPPSAPIPAVAARSPTKKSVLKPSAKEFVPSYYAAPFVPSTPPPPASIATALSPSAPAFTLPPTAAALVQTPEPVTLEEDVKNVGTKTETSSETNDSATSSTATTTTTVEQESEDVQETPAKEETNTTTVESEDASTTKETTSSTAATVEKEEVQEPEAQPTSSVDAAKVEAEQAVIKQRIMYTIAELLELEPEHCPIPANVVGMVVADEKANRTSTNDTSSFGGSNGGRNLRRENSRSRPGSGQFNDSRGGSRRGGRGRGGFHNANDTAPALEDCAPLAINEETRWKPTHAKSRLDEPVAATEASLKEAKAILNKLSIEKFDKLSDQLIEVAVRGIDVLKGVIDIVIEKAQYEWHFSAMYAELCSKIAQTEMPAIVVINEDAEKDIVQDTHKLFRKMLLQRCQKEFEAKPSTEGLEDLPEDERVEKELLIKRGTLGHIRFVGELFKQRMLSSRIMHECIGILFGDVTQPDEESLECLCKLLSTIGQTLQANAREQAELDHINNYYVTIKQLSGESQLLCTRVRFMLQDLLELRKNKWVARRKETKAMTIAEVHAEAAREAKEKEKASKSANNSGSSSARLQRSQSMHSSSASPLPLEKRRSASNMTGSGSASAAWKARAAAVNSSSSTSSMTNTSSSSGPVVDADGWETVSSGSRPKLAKTRSNSDRFPVSNGSAPRHPSSSSVSNVGLRANTFASLRQENASASNRKERGRSASTSSNSARKSGGKDASNNFNSNGKPPTSLPSKTRESPVSSPEKLSTKPTSSLSADAFEKQCKAILEEYVELRDLDEAVTSFAELASAEHHGLIATQSLNLGLEKGSKEREAVASFLAGLYEQNILTNASLAAAVHETLEFAEDLEIDIPLTLPYLGEMLAPSVATGGLTLPQIVESANHLKYNGKAAKLVAKTLQGVSDEALTKKLVDEASLDLASLLAEGKRQEADVNAFCAEWKLEYLL